jgi:hypothetical protein
MDNGSCGSDMSSWAPRRGDLVRRRVRFAAAIDCGGRRRTRRRCPLLSLGFGPCRTHGSGTPPQLLRRGEKPRRPAGAPFESVGRGSRRPGLLAGQRVVAGTADETSSLSSRESSHCSPLQLETPRARRPFPPAADRVRPSSMRAYRSRLRRANLRRPWFPPLAIPRERPTGPRNRKLTRPGLCEFPQG